MNFDVLIVVSGRYDSAKYCLWKMTGVDEHSCTIAADRECVARAKADGLCWQVLAARKAGDFDKVWAKIVNKGLNY